MFLNNTIKTFGWSLTTAPKLFINRLNCVLHVNSRNVNWKIVCMRYNLGELIISDSNLSISGSFLGSPIREISLKGRLNTSDCPLILSSWITRAFFFTRPFDFDWSKFYWTCTWFHFVILVGDCPRGNFKGQCVNPGGWGSGVGGWGTFPVTAVRVITSEIQNKE